MMFLLGFQSSFDQLSVRTGSVLITEEEQKLLAEEGIHLQIDMPLTKVHTCLCM